MTSERTISKFFVRHCTVAIFVEFAKERADITDLALYLLRNALENCRTLRRLDFAVLPPVQKRQLFQVPINRVSSGGRTSI